VDELYIDVGAKSGDEAAKYVELGDFGAFDDSVTEFGDGFIKAKAIDDRSGCAVMLKLLEEERYTFARNLFRLVKLIKRKG
jgi:endoglucanase